MAKGQRTDWHKLLQDILDDHLEVMSGKKVLEADREVSAHFRVDYFCRCGDESPAGYAATVAGIRPFSHLRGCNVIEYKSIHQTLSEQTFRSYLAKTLLLESRLESQGDTTLTIVLTRLPQKLLVQNRYGFHQITPWKYQCTCIADLDVTLLIQRKTRGINGGEPLAWLQTLEGDPRYQKLTWKGILDQDMKRTDLLKNVIMKISREDFMSYNDEIRRQAIEEAKPLLQREELTRVLTSILDIKPRLRKRYGAALAGATDLEELRRLETAIMRDLAD